jgi:hypothetical protein
LIDLLATAHLAVYELDVMHAMHVNLATRYLSKAVEKMCVPD